MNINATDELIRVLDEIDAKIKRLENSPNRAFVLIEYDTLSSFHWFNLCFKQFWDDFDRHSASQLLQYQNIVDTFSELSNRYVKLLREQIGYLGGVIDFNGKCVKNLPPVIFSEDNSKDVIGYYEECCKYEKDEEGKPLYTIRVDRDMHSEVIDGKNVPIDFYLFESDTLNDGHYKSLLGMHNCLNNIYLLMCTVCSYPERLIYGFQLDQEDIISALENGLRQYAMEVGKKVERDLKKIAQELKPSRNVPLTPDVWGQVMQREDEMYEQAIYTQVGEIDDKFLENISATKILLIDNYSLLEKVKTTCLDGEFFDIELSIGTHNLLSSLNADNLDLFYELVLRRNIIQREMFPNELGDKYEEWLNPTDERQLEEGEDTGLSDVRQAKLDEIIGILQKGNWKQPATADNVEQLLNTVFGKDTSLLDDGDTDDIEKMWSLVETGGGERMVIVPANFAGFFAEENLLAGSPKEISNALFGNGNQVNNINKGNSNRCSAAFRVTIPILKKYIDIIIRQG